MPPKRRAAVDPEATTPTKRTKTAEIETTKDDSVQNDRRVTRDLEPIEPSDDDAKTDRPLNGRVLKKATKSRSAQAVGQKQNSTDPGKSAVKKGNRDIKKAKPETIKKGEDSEGEEDEEEKPDKKTSVKRKAKAAKVDEDSQDNEDKPKKKAPVKRKTKEEKAAEMLPIKPRTANLRMFIGAHVSGAGGVQNSVHGALRIGANAFALFLKSQRKWENPALKDEHRDEFKTLCNHHAYAADKHVLPHGSYLVNLAQSEEDKANQAYNSFLDDVKRCEALGIKLYNFHPGNTGQHPRPEAISRIAKQLNKAIKATSTVVPVLETMAGGSNVIGSKFEDLRDIINEIEDKSRIGVCIDTCHIFAAGYDIRTPETFKETIDKFDKIVGLKYLKAFHMNDSKAPLGSCRDLHQNIGVGFLGLRAFHSIMNEPRFEGLPMILETPAAANDESSFYATEIKLLESLDGMDVTSKEFLDLEKMYAAKGEAERAKFQEQVDKKTEKEKKKAAGGGRRKKKAKADEDDLDDSE